MLNNNGNSTITGAATNNAIGNTKENNNNSTDNNKNNNGSSPDHDTDNITMLNNGKHCLHLIEPRNDNIAPPYEYHCLTVVNDYDNTGIACYNHFKMIYRRNTFHIFILYYIKINGVLKQLSEL